MTLESFIFEYYTLKFSFKKRKGKHFKFIYIFEYTQKQQKINFRNYYYNFFVCLKTDIQHLQYKYI